MLELGARAVSVRRRRTVHVLQNFQHARLQHVGNLAADVLSSDYLVVRKAQRAGGQPNQMLRIPAELIDVTSLPAS